ncbi:mannose-6-phosphate isomerase [Selenomonas sp. oral taxon 126]|uniref:type I phosphomannose isomerase catalytic subunit n=1 Tax=Selenomonas sp. oral taxon 126 TaxID=712528 RepID=UPI0008078575|nr:type I phosphomannose isomerase catalytic subunit [Selenomonas sp. oral taxon 126]ANR71793.1 mannose-6-phosphate isomerase [Selenomonas sp. oral taxon 126]
MKYPMKLIAPLKDYLWGGTRLRDEYGKETQLTKIAESWELACHKDGRSVIANGAAAGQTLADWLADAGTDALGTRAAKFPYFPLLIKLIDAHDDLSVQVHPNDDYALRVEGEFGKTELWYVVDAAPGAELLYGFAHEISKEEFARRIADNTLLDVVRHVPVQKGDVFFIPAGTLHAIGKGILICEIQQNSNTTYRIYDYGRIGADGKPRDLHIEKALDVTSLAPVPTHACGIEVDLFAGARACLLAACDYFTVYHLAVEGGCEFTVGEDSFQCLTALSGSMQLRSETDELSIKKGESVFLPANLGQCALKGTGELILSKI